MAVATNYTGCTVLMYDDSGTYLDKGIISSHDRHVQRIQLRRGIPMEVNMICSLLILTEPSPREYMGRVVRESTDLAFALFKGKEKEKRALKRYYLNFPAKVVALIRGGVSFPLHTSVPVNVLNISRNGIRFSAANNSLLLRDRFSLRMKIDENDRLFTAEVVNTSSHNENESEYGCRLLKEQA